MTDTITVEQQETVVVTKTETAVVKVFVDGPQGRPGPGGILLTWDGADYQPSQYKASIYPKEFRGPVNPSGVPGVVMHKYDVWVSTSN